MASSEKWWYQFYFATERGREGYAKRFTGKYKHELISGGVGHNLPQEAPRAFADALIEVDHF